MTARRSDRAAVVWRGPSALDSNQSSSGSSDPSGLDRGAPIRVQLVWESTNRKTGNVVQAYILRDDMSPLDAMRTESDASICGDCPLSGLRAGGGREGRACYVNIGHGPQATWRPDTADLDLQEAAHRLAGRFLRIGAYGDPAAVPLSVWARLTRGAAGWTGYTHQWDALSDHWQRYVMASVDSEHQARVARARGWRTFRVATHAEPTARTEIVCPNTTRGVQCKDCHLCDGTHLDQKAGRASIVIEAHGAGRKYVH